MGVSVALHTCAADCGGGWLLLYLIICRGDACRGDVVFRNGAGAEPAPVAGRDGIAPPVVAAAAPFGGGDTPLKEVELLSSCGGISADTPAGTAESACPPTDSSLTLLL